MHVWPGARGEFPSPPGGRPGRLRMIGVDTCQETLLLARRSDQWLAPNIMATPARPCQLDTPLGPLTPD
jgi:hypothetical protein